MVELKLLKNGGKTKTIDLMSALFAALFVVQFIVLLYFNLALVKNHMGYDSSWPYLKAVMMAKERTLTSPFWSDTTNNFWDGSLIIASIIYAIIGNIYVSYGIADMFILSMILMAMWSVLSKLNVDKADRFLALNMIICPYLTNGFDITNDLGYFSNLLGNAAYYNIRTLIVLLVIREFICLRKTEKVSIPGYVALFLSVVAGISSSIFIIAVIFLPFLLYELGMVFIKNDFRWLMRKECIYAICGSICVIFGKLISKVVLKSWTIDETRAWTPIEKVWENSGGVVQGLMKLLGVLPVTSTKVELMSYNGVCYIFTLFIFLVVITSIGYSIIMLKKELFTNGGILLFFDTVIVVTLVCFSLFNLSYGGKFFEERYLIPFFMVLIILVSIFCREIGRTSIFANTILIGLFISLLGTNFVSARNYMSVTNDVWRMQDIVDIVNAENAKIVYIWGDSYSNAIGKTLRVYDMDHIYKVIDAEGIYDHWGDYRYFDDNSEYSGETLIIYPTEQDYIPKDILDQYKLIETIDVLSISKCDHNPIDLKQDE